jgi:hypothetical protein
LATAEQTPDGGIPLTDSERRIWSDIDWAEKNDQVRREFAGEWVAVCDRHVVAHGRNRDQVLREAIVLTQRPVEELAIWSISDDEDLMKEPAASPGEV